MDIRFTFLSVALGHVESLPWAPTDKDWQIFYGFCKRQALLGIGFTAVEKLHEQGIECPRDLRMKWLALTLKIEKQNKILNQQCKELTEKLEHDGLQCCILKGQGNLLNYLEQLKWRRNPGDIDVWCTPPDGGLSISMQIGRGNVECNTYYSCKAIIEYVQMLNRSVGGKKRRALYHHIDAPDFNGTEVEVHYRPSFCHAPIRNYRMQRFFSSHADECMKNKNYLGFATPTPSVNVVYQMCHLFSHLFETGLGLRQFLDYYFTLKVWSDNYELRIRNYDLSAQADEKLLNYELSQSGIRSSQRMWTEGLGVHVMSKEEVMHTLRSFGMGKFAAAVMWVLHEVFAMSAHYYICEPNEKEGRKLLAEIMQGGNFGQYDERGKDMRNGGTIPHAIWKLKRVMRLVSSYPEEAICEPFFRVWHWGWRCLH